MNNSIKELNNLKNQLKALKKIHANYEWDIYEQRQNTKLKRGYSSINIRKVFLFNGYVTIDELSFWINDLEMKIKSFKIKKLMEYKYELKIY